MTTEWKRAGADVFWGEIAPHDHVVQIYENDDVFLDALAGFIGGGINAGECVIVIATSSHLNSLYARLSGYGINVPTLIDDDRYIPLDADATLAKFMVDGWPDEHRFNKVASSIMELGIRKGRRIRAFGEMVALLWHRGYHGGTIQLENLWNKLHQKNEFTLFCAYPRSGFTGNSSEAINTVCNCHSKMINGKQKQMTEIFYTETLQEVD